MKAWVLISLCLISLINASSPVSSVSYQHIASLFFEATETTTSITTVPYTINVQAVSTKTNTILSTVTLTYTQLQVSVVSNISNVTETISIYVDGPIGTVYNTITSTITSTLYTINPTVIITVSSTANPTVTVTQNYIQLVNYL